MLGLLQSCAAAVVKLIKEINLMLAHQGPVVRTPVSANPGLNFNPGFSSFLSKAHYHIIFSILFRVFNHQILPKRIKLNLLLKLS